MFGGNKVSDKELLKTVTKRLVRGGGGSLSAVLRQGTLTLSGWLQYESQRRPIIKLVSSIAGIRGVIDQLKLKPRNAY